MWDTLSHLVKVVKELKGTGYSPKMAYLGGKRHHCVHPKVMGKPGEEIDLACKQLLDTSAGCKFFHGYPKAVGFADDYLKVHTREN